MYTHKQFENMKQNSDAEISKDSELQKSASEPFFSIGVTTYDRVEMLIEALNSILGQTFRNFEVIVSNDNPDRTLTGASLGVDDTRVTFINQPKNLGEVYNMNFLLKSSRGKYFTWLADDDYYAPNFLQEVYKAIMTHGNESTCVLTSFKVVRSKRIPLYTLENEIKVGKVLISDGQQFLQDYWNGRIKVISTIGVYTKPYLMSIGGLKKLTNMPIGLFSEYLLIMEISLLKKVIFIDAPLIYYRAHEESWSASNKNHEYSQVAGINFLKMSIEIFKSPLVRENYFQKNLTGAMKLILREVAHISVKRGNILITLFNIKYLGTFKSLIWALKGTELYHRGVQSFSYASLWFLLYFPKILLITILPNSIKIIAKKMISYVRGEIV